MAYLSIIVPVYNQAETILPFYYHLVKKLPEEFELIFVNDGSTDITEMELEFLAKKDSRLCYINLSRHFGMPAAVMAGMDHATGTHVVVMKGDLQNPVQLLPEMITQLEEGTEIVNTELSNQLPVSWPIKIIMNGCYRILQYLAVRKKSINITDFRAYSIRIIDQLRLAHKKNLMPGLFFNWSEFSATTLFYEKQVCQKEEIRFTIQHLLREVKKVFRLYNSLPARTIYASGLMLLATGCILAGLPLIQKQLNLFTILAFTLLATALVTGGIWILFQGTLRLRLLKELNRLYLIHQYDVKEILDRDQLLGFDSRKFKQVGQL